MMLKIIDDAISSQKIILSKIKDLRLNKIKIKENADFFLEIYDSNFIVRKSIILVFLNKK